MLVETAKCLLQDKCLPPCFWVEAVYCANYLLKHISTKFVPSTILVERWCGNNPSIDHLLMFGRVSWDHIFDDYIKKLDAKSHSCIMMADYSEESKSY